MVKISAKFLSALVAVKPGAVASVQIIYFKQFGYFLFFLLYPLMY